MAENTEQTKRDALFLLDALKHVTTKVVVRQLFILGVIEKFTSDND
jgi:hypothetical protein